nr:helix-turn-helix transcriptional regulator [Nonomuraea phyllanthi]
MSSREREVALLAAEGKTNQEIATELFLSRRTVESHIASALRKLGVPSRKELRALADDGDGLAGLRARDGRDDRDGLTGLRDR